MLFWAGILTGGFFAWLAVKAGFYETIVMLFNIVISIYVSLFLTPVITKYFSAENDTLFFNTFALAIIAIGTFLILYAIAYTFLTGQFKVAFHKIFELLFSGIFGFLTGFLVFSFAALVITVTPLSQNRFISQIGFNKQSQKANISYICWWCDLVNTVVSSDEKMKSEDVIDKLLKNAQMKESENKDDNNPNPSENQKSQLKV
ncbi:MAG: CvpA family protein [Sedimentisphaerales bacterium]|nr:CvpA family protein [Sedimentisphaerales bacterium]